MPKSKKQYLEQNSQFEHQQRKMKVGSAESLLNDEFFSATKRRKLLLTCVVCLGDAHGYNFDAISCESCKAFFRRNALRPPGKLKCHGDGNCDVTFNIRKRCKKCRLEKCLKTGMRKEWILSDKEKQEKREKIEANRRLRQIQENNLLQKNPLKSKSITECNSSSLEFSPAIDETFFNDSHQFKLKSTVDCFTEAVKLNQLAGISLYPSVYPIRSTLELFSVPLYIISMRFITYIKQIREFQNLCSNDHMYLVKLNLLSVVFLHSIFIYDPRTHSYHERNTSDPIFLEEDWAKTLNSKFHLEMTQLRHDLIDIFQSDDIIIKLFFLILLFSNRISLNQSFQYPLIDVNSSGVSNAQNVYTDLAYRYCLQHYGRSKAPLLFLRCLTKIMKIQRLVDEVQYSINDYLDITQLSPLMQSLLL